LEADAAWKEGGCLEGAPTFFCAQRGREAPHATFVNRLFNRVGAEAARFTAWRTCVGRGGRRAGPHVTGAAKRVPAGWRRGEGPGGTRRLGARRVPERRGPPAARHVAGAGAQQDA